LKVTQTEAPNILRNLWFTIVRLVKRFHLLEIRFTYNGGPCRRLKTKSLGKHFWVQYFENRGGGILLITFLTLKVSLEQLFVYEGQKCIFFIRVWVFWPRLNRRAQRSTLFFRQSHELQSKRHHWKKYKFILYLGTFFK
jgi:hypothetical protein